jgi:hypothetical protein
MCADKGSLPPPERCIGIITEIKDLLSWDSDPVRAPNHLLLFCDVDLSQLLTISVAAMRLCTTLFEIVLLLQPIQVVSCISILRPHLVAMAEAPTRWREYTLRQKSGAQIAWVTLFASILAPESPQPLLFPWSDLAGGGDGSPDVCVQGSAIRRSVALALEKNAAALDVIADVGWRHDPYRSLGISPPNAASILHAMRTVIQIARLSPDAAAALCR